MTDLATARLSNEDDWSRYYAMQDKVRESSLALVIALIRDAFPDAHNARISIDEDDSGLELNSIILPSGALTYEDLDEQRPALLEELSDLLRSIRAHWVETNRRGYGYIWCESTHAFEPDPTGVNGPMFCRHDGLSAENARHCPPDATN